MHKNQFGITRMNLEHLKTFHVVASLGSFTEAAKALYPVFNTRMIKRRP